LGSQIKSQYVEFKTEEVEETMISMTIELPETVFSALRKAPAEFLKEMRIEAAAQWYAHQRISQDKGAEIAGISRAEFIDELASRKIPVDQSCFEELVEESRRD
jgi:predicted HTH domain antitoxin